MAAKKKRKVTRGTKPKPQQAALDADTKKQIIETIRDSLAELVAEFPHASIDYPVPKFPLLRAPQPTACDDAFTELVPIYAFGTSEDGAKNALEVRSRQESQNSAGRLQCSTKTCPTTDEVCRLDYGHVVMDCKRKTFTTNRGRTLTLWFCWGFHIAGCFCFF